MGKMGMQCSGCRTVCDVSAEKDGSMLDGISAALWRWQPGAQELSSVCYFLLLVRSSSVIINSVPPSSTSGPLAACDGHKNASFDT